jgi:CO/xanthine dehydrogenase Mo-binding subunit
MSVIGQSPPRPDGPAKVRGVARYGDDTRFEGMVHGATVRSPHARARLGPVRWDPERAGEGAVCVTAEDLPGPNGVQLIDDRWPVLAEGEVRHVGEPVALVAAPTREAAQRALGAVEVDYWPLPPVFDLDGREDDEPLAALELGCGDVERALEEADRVVEGTYRTGHQEHIYIECQTMTAWFETDGTLVVEGSMQCPYYVHKSLVHAFGLPPERVRVRAAEIGGGFGGKEDYPSMIALHAALLARATGRPARIAYERHEDIVGTTKRHPAVVRHRSGVDAEGRLRAMEIDIVMDGGAYATLSSVVLSRAMLHATGPYRCPNVRVRGRVLPTNTATNGAFRGFGAPQSQFAAERQIDRIARAVGIDPLEMRLRNVVEEGDELFTGQVLDETTAARECLERVAAATDFRRRWRAIERGRRKLEDGQPASGIGLSLYFHGAGFTGNGERAMRSPVRVRLDDSGRIELRTAQTDLGQGMAAVFRQIVRAAAGVLDDDIVLTPPDTAEVPDSGPTAASRTTMIVGGTIALAVEELRSRLLDWWREREGLAGEARFEDGELRHDGDEEDGDTTFREVACIHRAEQGELEVVKRHEPPADQTFDEETYRGDAYQTYGWGADVVELTVDPDTLAVTADKVTAVCEVGRALHPVLCAGQVEGGTLQALGWALMEEVKMDRGRYLNDRLATYIIPTAKDGPRIEVELLERPWRGGPFGAKGVGELPMDGGAPAAIAAVENATGIVAARIPATPERLFDDLRAGSTVDGSVPEELSLPPMEAADPTGGDDEG